MKIAALVLGLIGSLILFVLGVMWAGQYQDLEKSELYQVMQDARTKGQTNPEMEKAFAEAERVGTAGYVCVGLGLLAFLASPFVFKFPKVSGGLMAAAVLGAAVMNPKTLVFSFLLAVAALLAFLVKPRRMAAAAVAVCALALGTAACGGGEAKTGAAGGGTSAAAKPAAETLAWKPLDKLGLQVEAPASAAFMDWSQDAPAGSYSSQGFSVRVSQITPAFAQTFERAKQEHEKDPGCVFKSWTKAETTADGWHLQWQCENAIGKDVNHAVEIRRRFGAKAVDCWEKVPSAEDAARTVKACQSLKPIGS